MKINILGVSFYYAVISLTSGTEYQYQYDNNKTCIMFRAEVLFTLTNGKDEVKLDGTNFTVKGGDCALPNESDASLFLTTSREDYFTLYFKYDEKNQTSMDAMFTFAPYQYFPHSSTPNIITLIDTGDLFLGGNRQLFLCNPPNKMILNGTLEGITYTMIMDMSNTEIQAFNIKDGILSSNIYKCSDDKMFIIENNHTPTKINSTETDVTTPISKATANVKTMVDSNRNSTDVRAYTEPLTSNITTNTATPSTYIYQNVDSIPCLIIKGIFGLEVTYDNTTTSIDVPSSKDVVVTGKCAKVNEIMSTMILTPKSGPLKSFTFNLKINEKYCKYDLESINAKVTIKDKPMMYTVNTNIQLSSSKSYINSRVGGNISDGEITFKFEKMRIQALNRTN